MANLLPGYTKVTTQFSSNSYGAGIIVVKWNGKQKSVPSNLKLSGINKHSDAITVAIPTATEVEYDIDQRGNRKTIVWIIRED